jgi:hypothetical protein
VTGKASVTTPNKMVRRVFMVPPHLLAAVGPVRDGLTVAMGRAKISGGQTPRCRHRGARAPRSTTGSGSRSLPAAAALLRPSLARVSGLVEALTRPS